MEKPKREKANLLKTVATAGLVFLAGGQAEAQNSNNWLKATEQEYKRLNPPDSKVQKVSAKNFEEADETKEWRIYTDNGGNAVYWKNLKKPKTKEEVLAGTPAEDPKAISENELAELRAKNKKNTPPDIKDNLLTEATKEDTININEEPVAINKAETTPPPNSDVSDVKEEPPIEVPADVPAEDATIIAEKPIVDVHAPEISDMPPIEEKDPAELEMDTIMGELEEYSNRFEVDEAYFINSAGQKYKVSDIPEEAFKNKDEKTTLSGALVIRDKDTHKEYEVLTRNRSSITDDDFYFAEALKKSDARGACLELLTRQGKTDLSTDEKIAYLQNFFGKRIKKMHNYNQPKIDESKLIANATAEELK